MRPLYMMFAAVTILIAGCSTNSASKYKTRPFFLPEQDLATHGRKSGFDRLIETDPGSTDYIVASDYQEQPPRRIAVLPFVDHGNGEYIVDKYRSAFTRARENLIVRLGLMPIGCDAPSAAKLADASSRSSH
jgi:hypothetical protein